MRPHVRRRNEEPVRVAELPCDVPMMRRGVFTCCEIHDSHVIKEALKLLEPAFVLDGTRHLAAEVFADFSVFHQLYLTTIILRMAIT